MSLIDEVQECLRRYERGVHSADELGQHLFWDLLGQALIDRRDEVADALLLITNQFPFEIGVFQWIPFSARRIAREPSQEGLAVDFVLDAVREAFVSRIRDGLHRDAERPVALTLLRELPAAWASLELIHAALESPYHSEERISVYSAVLPCALAVIGSDQAFRVLIEPILDRTEPVVVELLIRFISEEDLTSRPRIAVLDALLKNLEAISAEELLKLLVVLITQGRDLSAGQVARELLSRDALDVDQVLPLAAAFQVMGFPEQAGALAKTVDGDRLEEWDEFGWKSQGLRSLHRFFAVAGEPSEKVITLLTSASSEHPGSSIAAVGALVGRLALMRMRAYSELGNLRMAGHEALGVLSLHGYRGSVLHAAPPGFDVRLTSRLAVTPDELVEARAVVDASGLDPEQHTPSFMEGRLFPRISME